MRLLVGDVGGTNTRLAMFDGSTLSNQRRWRNESLSHLNEAVELYVKDHPPFDAACLGVAGPVRRGRAPMMNYPWVVEQKDLEQITRSPVRLINDFHAQSLAVLHLRESDIERLDEIPHTIHIVGEDSRRLGSSLMTHPAVYGLNFPNEHELNIQTYHFGQLHQDLPRIIVENNHKVRVIDNPDDDLESILGYLTGGA